MKKMLILMVAVAVAAISYSGTGPVLAVWGTADYQSDTQSFTAVGGGTANVDSGSLPSGVLYLCADDAEEEEAPAEEEKEDEPVPGVDRTWNVVMYG